MKYVSIDIETCGLNKKKCDIIQFAATIDDLSDVKPLDRLPTFQAHFIKNNYKGEPFALSMHQAIFKKIALASQRRVEENEFGDKFMKIKDLPIAFKNFLTGNGFEEDKWGKIRVNVAGKNVAMFDMPFLNENIKDWKGVSFLHRVIDPAILYYQPGDVCLPDSKLCMERAGLAGEVAHTALEDTLMVVKLIRHKLLK